jgi:HemY protein
MRGAVWIVLLFAAAVVAALAFGGNDGLVSIYFSGWRTDLSLNFFLLLLLASCTLLVLALRAVDAVGGLPKRAREWRENQRERAAAAALREAQLEYLAARYGRAAKAAQRALALHRTLPEAGAAPRPQDEGFVTLAQLLAAAALHRLQDKGQRDALWLAAGRSAHGSRRSEDAVQLLGAEWALEDRDAPKALEQLAALQPGAARRTQALRLRLQAARLAAQPQAALHTARLLAKHQAFSPHAAHSLLRSLCAELLDTAADLQRLRALWQGLEALERADPIVASHAARRAVGLGGAEDARLWLRAPWETLHRLDRTERAALALALAEAAQGAGSDWLARVEQAQGQWPQEPAVQAAVAALCVQRQLWGKARPALEATLAATELPLSTRRAAARELAQLARQQGDESRAARIEHEAAAMG